MRAPPPPSFTAEDTKARLDEFFREDPRDAALSKADVLKNALLSLLLLSTCKPDLDETCNMNYASFDGKKLPIFSGCNVSNACMSYMSRFLPHKREAIDKYLAAHIATDEQTEALFEAFLARVRMPADEEGGEDFLEK